MCTFLSVTLPVSANVEACRALFQSKGLVLAPVEAGQQPSGVENSENYYFTCAGVCDCSTDIASDHLRSGHLRDSDSDEEIIRDLRKKKWSDAKIERRLEALRRTKAKIERAEQAKSDHWPGDAQNWVELFEVAIQQKMTRYIGLTANFYAGSIYEPDFALVRTDVALRAVTTTMLRALRPATLLVVS